MIHDVNLRLSPKEASDDQTIYAAALRKAGLKDDQVGEWRVVRRSIDARKSPVVINLMVKIATADDHLAPVVEIAPYKHVDAESPTIVIVGAGPAGLFAALKALQCGIKPIILERGKDVDSRRLDLANISRSGKINPQSNYCFGEGGAGAYSDGKLFTRSKKRGNVNEVLKMLVDHGAKTEIMIDSHPHIGSDVLPKVIRNIRETILSHGGEIHFNTRADKLIIDNNKAVGVIDSEGNEYKGAVLLATGHSARDTIMNLHENGVKMEPKGFAVGVRLEHPQSLIDSLQYHTKGNRNPYLPAAEYSFVSQEEGRGVYSFCMCPGGVIVPAGSDSGELVVNGMSASARAGDLANSGIVVEIRPGDFPEYTKYGELELLKFQHDLERRFYEMSGNSIVAPAQRVPDFVKGKLSESLPKTTYAPGVQKGDFNELFPPFISTRLKSGLESFNRKCKGFVCNDAVMIGLESRTSCPIRIPRDKETYEHVEIENLYPAGEGAGYAGGITSAALDGQKCVEAYANKLRQRTCSAACTLPDKTKQGMEVLRSSNT